MQPAGEWFRWSDETFDDETHSVLQPAASHRPRTSAPQNYRGAAWFRWSDEESEDEAQPMVVLWTSQITRTDVFPNYPGAAAPNTTANEHVVASRLRRRH